MKNLDNLNILIVGVGGQGTLLASKFLGAVAVQCGKDVKVSEVHGMSQRGGSVVTCVKIGNNIHSPIIDLGEADIMLSFEQVEAVRWLPYLKKGGKIITGTIAASQPIKENLLSSFLNAPIALRPVFLPIAISAVIRA